MKDPQVVKVGQVVKVLEVDEKHKRRALTMRLTDTAAQQTSEARGSGKREQSGDRKNRSAKSQQKQEARPDTAMATAFARLKR